MKKLLVLLLVLVMSLSLVACGGDDKEKDDSKDKMENEQEKEKDDEKEDEEKEDMGESMDSDKPVVVATAGFNGDFYEGWSNSSYDKSIRRLVWGFGLMMDNPDGQIVDSPLVEEKKVSDDFKTWTFKIKKGVKFHNGEELTASDVKFTYDFYLNKDAMNATGGTTSLPDYLDSVTMNEEENSVEFKLKNALFNTDALIFYENWILPEETIKKGAEEAKQNVHEYVKTNISKPIGYGAYIFDEYKESEYVRLKINPDYIGTMPKIKEIIVKVTPSETELDQLIQGDVDVLTEQVEAEKIDGAIDADFAYNDYFRHGGGTMILHTDFGPFQLTEVRQAFAYVFNRPKVIELFLGKYGIASNGPYSKNHWMLFDDDEKDLIGTAAVSKFEASLNNYDIVDADGKFDEAANIAKAHELLDAAVAKTDGEYAKLTGDAKSGYMWDGKPMEIKITFTEFWSDTYNLVWTDEYISKLGFKVTLHGLDWPVMYDHWTGATQEDRQYNAFVGGVSYVLKDNPASDYSSSKILPWGQTSSNGPRFKGGSSYTPEEWDKLLHSIAVCDPVNGAEDYKKLWREYVKTFNKEMPIIPVYSNHYHDLYNPNLENFNTKALWPWSRAILEAYWK